MFLGSPMSLAKAAGVGLIVGGVVTLNLAGAR
jgi:small multidrug resistance pump